MKKIYFLLSIMAIWSCSLRLNAQVLPADSLALVDFYNAAGGPNWTDQGNWLTGPVSTWSNVTVTNGRVTKLTVALNNMSGTISPSVGQLTELVEFRIQGDEANRVWVDIHGSIPAELWNCTKIALLQIKFTNITGNIPAGIEKMTALKEVNFQATYLESEIPAAIFNLPNLTKAYLHESNFTGKVPSTLVNATKLVRLYLQKNKLTAGLPFVNIPAENKAKVELTGNYFSFADVKPYHDAKANYAGFTDDYQYAKEPVTVSVAKGTEYTMTGDVTDAEAYAWFKNTETVPVGTEASQKVTLNTLSDEATYTCKAQSSMVAGCDVRSIYNLKLGVSGMERDSLALVDFYNAAGGPNWTDQGNWLTGPVSTWSGVTVTDGRVTKLTVALNNMSGTVSPSVGQLTELVEFRIQGDEANRVWVDIHGSIPAELWNCTKIALLQIKFTNITGNIPAGIEKMTALKEVNFQATYLESEIPAAIFNLPNLTKAYLHESNFTGKVPSTLVNATKLVRLYLQKNKLSAGLPFVNIPSGNKAKVELTGNYFSFADVKPYHDAKANYAGFTDDYQYAKEPVTVSVAKGTEYTMTGDVTDAEAYAWFKNTEPVPVGTEASQKVTLNTLSDEATYTCKAQSSMVAGCDIRSIYNLKLGVSGMERDSLALVDFYNAAGGPNWTDQGNWLTGPVSTWSGVTVTDGRVTKLTVALNNMSGTVSPSVGQLTELVEFRIQGDEANRVWVDIHGSIPAELWNCTKIALLQIKFTNITGNIPAGIEKMTALKEVNFQATYLESEIPAAIFNLPNLTKAYLHESNFTGKVPSTLVNATKLVRLYLQKNKLSAGLPFVNIPSGNKAKVELTGNYFSFADVKPYHDAKANYAGFTDDYQYAKEPVTVSVAKGTEYTMTGDVTDAEAYAWFKNTEPVPVGTEASQKVTLNTLSDEATYTCKAQSSMVAGCDIRSIYNLKLGVSGMERDSLALVDFYNAAGGPNWTDQGNWLTGPVSTWSGVTVTDGRVTKLTVALNNMSGTISPSIGQLTELVEFRIQGDEANRVWVDIHGSIPAELWNCTKIALLQIKFTNITGNIPAGIEKMTALKEVNFQATYLESEIPAAIFNLPNLTKAYLHESNFTGKVPSTLVNATKLVRLYLQKNKLSAGLPFVNIPSGNKAKVELTGNYFSFADVKPYHDAKANYAGFTDDYQYAQETQDLTAAVGSSVTMSLVVPDAEAYFWFKDDATTPVGTDSDLTINPVTAADQATYTCKVQSSLVSSFDIRAIFNLNGGTVTGISQLDNTLKTFPNPVADVLNIQSSSPIRFISIYDISGRKVFDLNNVPTNIAAIPVSNLQKGIYIVSVKTNSGVLTQKFVKE